MDAAAAGSISPLSTDEHLQLQAADRLISLTRAAATEPRPDPHVEALALAVAANLPVLLWGQPGIGKSSTLVQLARGLALPLETVIASVHDPSDFAGLPIVGADPASQGIAMAPPDWAVRLHRAGSGLLFLDEISSAPPAVQAALLRVVLERQVGSLALPAPVRIVAAANPAGSAADGWQLAPPLANRFVHLAWVHDPDVVVRGLGGVWPHVPLPRLDPGALERSVARARAAICAFLTVRPDYAHRMPTTAAARGGAWPSPRTWEMALRLLAFGYAADAKREAVAIAIRGAVGDGAGLEFLAFLERQDLPDPEAVLADPERVELPERGDLVHATLAAVVDAIGRYPIGRDASRDDGSRHATTTRERWEAGWTLIARLAKTVPVDLLAAPAMQLAALREPHWELPAQLDGLAALEALLARDPEALLLAVDPATAELVGTVIAGWDGWRCHRYRLAVHPDRRRAGLGRLLVDAAEARVRAVGGARADAMVLDGNDLAHHAWRAGGYAPQAEWSRWVKAL
ncbi:GNAT family N-acetyltransferase [Catenulispora pinisilvae]|uniref:GNAT family N-acetyltransferase n=1 Tax=Catenulispora pinisilvae TaxID=2705253 RepID=UPI0034DD2B17